MPCPTHPQAKFAGTRCGPIVRCHPRKDICCSPTLLLTCVRAPLYVYFTIHTCIYDPLYVSTYKPRVVVPSPLLPLVYPIVSMCSIWLISLEPLLFYNLSWSLGFFPAHRIPCPWPFLLFLLLSHTISLSVFMHDASHFFLASFLGRIASFTSSFHYVSFQFQPHRVS